MYANGFNAQYPGQRCCCSFAVKFSYEHLGGFRNLKLFKFLKIFQYNFSKDDRAIQS